MSVNSNPVSFFIPHENYKFEVDLIKKNEVQKILPSDQHKGKILLVVGIIELVASAAFFFDVIIAASTLPVILPIGVCTLGVVTLALAVFFFKKKTLIVEEEQLPVRFEMNQHFDELLKISPHLGEESKYKNGVSKESLLLNLYTILCRPEFRIDPLGYIAKWKELRGEMKEFKIEEDLLLNYFIRDDVQKYLTLNKPVGGCLPPPPIPQPFIPNKHYQWSTISDPKDMPKAYQITKFTYDHFEKMGRKLQVDLSTEFGANVFAILSQKDFLADPLEYIAKWKNSRGGKEIMKEPEDNLLLAFTNDKIQKYLTTNFSRLYRLCTQPPES